MVKNLPATQETWVLSLRWEDPLEKGKAPHSSILAWRIPGTCIVRGVAESQTQLSDFDFISLHTMYECESWIIKKAEYQRIDAFELWCWRRLLRVPWIARRSHQSNPK